ncbi:MAG: fibronectin type III domain-containing protein [Gemmatimonadetes bacterium]|nr:fibronectin type III domain-containing protein [Gemmatimonadota bacterium]
MIAIRRLPAAPSALTAVATSATSATLRWSDNADNESAFIIERCARAGCTAFPDHRLQGRERHELQRRQGRTAAATYRYRVRARNSVGISAFIGPVSVVLGGPAAPERLSATTISGTQIDLTWTDATEQRDRLRRRALRHGVCGTDRDFVGRQRRGGRDPGVPEHRPRRRRHVHLPRPRDQQRRPVRLLRDGDGQHDPSGGAERPRRDHLGDADRSRLA